MNSHLEALMDVLSQETVLYQKMANILQEERASAIASDLNGLHAARLQKEGIIAAIGQLEPHRQGLVHALARQWFDAPGPVSLSQLADRLDPPAARRLARCREALAATLERVSALNTRNASLLAHSAQWVTGAIRLLDHLLHPQAVYQRSGRFIPGGRTGRVLDGTC